MIYLKKHIPNFLTCCNLFCGCIGISKVMENDLVFAAYSIFAAAVFDFFDGFAARLLKVSSPIGKELDSLADMTSFGVLPGFIVYQLFSCTNTELTYLPYIAFLIPIFSALRLAKFNIDTRQSDSFIGLPTPANSIFIASLPLILNSTYFRGNSLSLFANSDNLICSPYLLAGISIIMSALLVAELPLFALKFKHYGWQGNQIRYIFLIISALCIPFLYSLSIPIIIFLYIILSIIGNRKKVYK